MSVETVRSALLWCSVINFAILLLWAALAILGRDWLYHMWGRFYRLSAEQFDLINMAGMTFYKVSIILFNIVPCVALYLVK